jgi:hypothetical protein
MALLRADMQTSTVGWADSGGVETAHVAVHVGGERKAMHHT